ncbi:MAG TPA: DUF1697 domain-containing protein [Candidatus Baltobacteraceae bacterium]|nr:DUF1697 domain-containing protein [Candidatus Baltobacteraceae bacterium]
MTRHVALLRAVNVGGRNTIAMADLVALATRLGLRDARTLLQSGNLVFAADAAAAKGLEERLEEETQRRLGLATTCIVRSAPEWSQIVARNPFGVEAAADPGHLLVMPLKAEPATGALEALRAAIVGRERVELAGRTAYLVYPDGAGTSKLTAKLIESKLGTRGTARNWNTVRKLLALLEG